MSYSPHEEEGIIGYVWLLVIVLLLWLMHGGTSL